MDDLSREAEKATGMLAGLTVRVVRRHRLTELLIEFEDGTRLIVDGEGASISRSPGGQDD